MKPSHRCLILGFAGRLRTAAGLLLAATVLLCPRPATAQQYYYMFGPNSFSDPLPVKMGSVDLSNGNLELAIPIASMPERGHIPFQAAMVYESHFWQKVSASGSLSWQPTNVAGSIGGGWKMVETGQSGSVSSTFVTLECGSLGLPYTQNTNYAWTAPNGRLVPFGLETSSSNSCHTGSSTAQGMAADGSGYQMFITSSAITVYAVDGTQVYPEVEDTNGNYYSLDSNGNSIDTLGRTPVTATSSGTPPTYTYTVLNSMYTGTSGAYQVTVTTESIPVNTDFGQTSVSEYSGNITVVKQITLPDGSTYSFDYDKGSSGAHYGTLTSMTLPTGGTVTFSNSVFEDAYSNKYLYLASCDWGGGSWTYSPEVITSCGTSCSQQVTVTKPAGSSGTNNEVHIFTFYGTSGGYFWGATPWVTQQNYYAGTSTLLEGVQTVYTSAPNIYQQTITTTLPLASGNLEKQTQIAYTSNNAGTATTITEYGFGSGAPAGPRRETGYSYYSDPRGLILNAPQTISVSIDSGYSETITYDSYGSGLTSVTGAPNHDDTNFGTSNTDRGNPTSIAIGSQTVTTLTYDTTGQVLTSTDASGNTTHLSYGDRFYHDNGANPPATYTPSAGTNAYLTGITLPTPSSGVTQTWSIGYYFGSGKPALMYEPNAHPSYFHTDGPGGQDPWDRIVETLPILGWQYTDYVSPTEADTYVAIQNPTPGTSCSTAGSCSHYQTILDSDGRVSSQSLVNDPDGESTSTASYYGNSEPDVVTPLLRSGDQPVADTYTYDGLGRPLTDTNAQGTAKSWYYGAYVSSGGGLTSQACSATTYGYGYPMVSVDESGYRRETWTNELGNVIEVDEPSPSGGSFSSGYSTCYTYDGFGHALQVTQGTQTRTYTYDSSERLTKAVTPESGTVNYYYSSGGGLCSGNINLVCKMTDARSISTTYFYDALSRLTIKEYSDSTPAAYFYYDESSVWGVSPTNPVGRLTLATANSNGTVFSYDAKGRINETWQVNGSVGEHELYTWNYDGSLASITYPSGRVVNYAVGNAGRATSATDGSGYQYAAPQGGYWPEYAAFGPLETMLNGAVPGGFAGIANYSTWANGIPRLVLYGEAAVVGGSYIMNYANFPLANLNFEAVWDDMNLNRSQTYTYDYLQRITSAVTTGTSGADCWGQGFGSGGYSYDDRYSNMSQMTVSQCSAGSLDEAITSTTNQFTGFAYDSSGNETGGIGTQTYDAENRMSTSGYPGFTLTNAFDALNLKITKTRSDGLYPKMYWRDIWGNTLSESDSSGHMLNDYIYFAGKRIAYVTNTGATYFYLTDQIGSVRKIADQNGVVCYDADYTPYGQQIYVAANSCPAQPYLFAGMERDDNAFDYDFARYYSYRLGRFMSADPLGGNVLNPQSLNRYTYVLNDPINLTDPSGMNFCVQPKGQGAHNPFVPGCNPHETQMGDDPDGMWAASALYWQSAFTGAYDYQTFDGNYIGGNWTGWSPDQGFWETTIYPIMGNVGSTGDDSMGPYAGALGVVGNNLSGLVSGKTEVEFLGTSAVAGFVGAGIAGEAVESELEEASLTASAVVDTNVEGGTIAVEDFIEGLLTDEPVTSGPGVIGRIAQIASDLFFP